MQLSLIFNELRTFPAQIHSTYVAEVNVRNLQMAEINKIVVNQTPAITMQEPDLTLSYNSTNAVRGQSLYNDIQYNEVVGYTKNRLSFYLRDHFKIRYGYIGPQGYIMTTSSPDNINLDDENWFYTNMIPILPNTKLVFQLPTSPSA